MNELHGAVGALLLPALVGFGLVAAAASALDRGHAWLDRARQLLLVALVAEGAVGVALALRGPGPGELLHWLYGLGATLLLLVPLTAAASSPRSRSATIAVGALLAGVLAWRLGATG